MMNVQTLTKRENWCRREKNHHQTCLCFSSCFLMISICSSSYFFFVWFRVSFMSIFMFALFRLPFFSSSNALTVSKNIGGHLTDIKGHFKSFFIDQNAIKVSPASNSLCSFSLNRMTSFSMAKMYNRIMHWIIEKQSGKFCRGIFSHVPASQVCWNQSNKFIKAAPGLIESRSCWVESSFSWNSRARLSLIRLSFKFLSNEQDRCHIKVEFNRCLLVSAHPPEIGNAHSIGSNF